MRRTVVMVTVQKNRIIIKHKRVQKDHKKRATRKKYYSKRARRKRLLQKNNKANKR